MRRPPPPHPRGTPRTPGSGRKRGTPNRKTVELRQLMGALAGDVDYQERFSRAFRRRRLHPSTEKRVWEYAIGKPKEQIEMSATLSMDARLAAERELFARWTSTQLEELAAESQALVDRAAAHGAGAARAARRRDVAWRGGEGGHDQRRDHRDVRRHSPRSSRCQRWPTAERF